METDPVIEVSVSVWAYTARASISEEARLRVENFIVGRMWTENSGSVLSVSF
jgi:hypothetical protein